MIDAKELRIGNYVNLSDTDLIEGNQMYEYLSVDIITADHIIMCEEFNDIFNHFYEPIPITEEWLFRFGAKIVVVKEIKYYVINGLSFLYNGVDGYYIGLGKGFSVYVGYVHKLQNIYYEIRGKELEIQ